MYKDSQTEKAFVNYENVFPMRGTNLTHVAHRDKLTWLRILMCLALDYP